MIIIVWPENAARNNLDTRRRTRVHHECKTFQRGIARICHTEFHIRLH